MISFGWAFPAGYSAGMLDPAKDKQPAFNHLCTLCCIHSISCVFVPLSNQAVRGLLGFNVHLSIWHSPRPVDETDCLLIIMLRHTPNSTNSFSIRFFTCYDFSTFNVTHKFTLLPYCSSKAASHPPRNFINRLDRSQLMLSRTDNEANGI
jgi:hypothetical protein